MINNSLFLNCNALLNFSCGNCNKLLGLGHISSSCNLCGSLNGLFINNLLKKSYSFCNTLEDSCENIERLETACDAYEIKGEKALIGV